MKENSIEENIEILEKFKNNEMQRDKLEREGYDVTESEE